MKKRIIPILSLLLLFCLSACSAEPEMNFEFDKQVMIDMTKSVVTSYNALPDESAEYLLAEGENIEKTAVAGFRQAQTTDQVGNFTGFDTSEDVVTFENGAKGDILCSIIAKYENRDVRVTVSYSENKLFKARYAEEYKTMEGYAAQNGYATPDDFVKGVESLQQLGYRTTSAKDFITDLLMYSQDNPVTPYKPLECEVTAVYSTSELLLKGAKNMGVGMGVVFAVLIFIAVIIYLLRFIPKLLGKDKKASGASKKPEAAPSKPKAAPIPKGPAVAAASRAEGELVTDGELIAVITAALHAYLADASQAGTVHPPAYTASNDTLVVRSIRRVRK